jgi:hypothetical protein
MLARYASARVTPDQSVEHFQRVGFIAHKRDRAMGETVLVAISVVRHRDSITELINAVYLYPVECGRWRIYDMSARSDDIEYSSLEDVVSAIELLLSQKLAVAP